MPWVNEEWPDLILRYLGIRTGREMVNQGDWGWYQYPIRLVWLHHLGFARQKVAVVEAVGVALVVAVHARDCEMILQRRMWPTAISLSRCPFAFLRSPLIVAE